MNYSKNNSTENLKITYYLGAGASYHAIPIWKKQGSSMIKVAEETLVYINSHFRSDNVVGPKPEYEFLRRFFTKLKIFGDKAVEFGSIDIYARRLYLLKDYKGLNDLKRCVSVYFDLWESGFLECSKGMEKPLLKMPNSSDSAYEKIDKRYFSLFSVLLEQGEDIPKLNSNVSFISWNYDLQLEKSIESFLPTETKSFKDLNNAVNQDGVQNIIHLNGYRGVFEKEGEELEIVEKLKFRSLHAYLKVLAENENQFIEDEGFQCRIMYAWEMDSNSKRKALEVMSKTNVLVIIGYSFPAFNRAIDQELIKKFEEGTDYKKVIYQDPFANEDIINSLFRNPGDVQVERENTGQLYIPHELLSPSPGEFFVL